MRSEANRLGRADLGNLARTPGNQGTAAELGLSTASGDYISSRGHSWCRPMDGHRPRELDS
jgi:hypothetical protein